MERMNTGSFRMAGLDEFAVTFTDHRKPAEVDIEWDDWYRDAGYPGYELRENKLVFDTQKKPEGLNVIMPEHDPAWELEWAK